GRGRSERDLSSDGWAFLVVEALDPEARRLVDRSVLAGLIARLGSGDPFARAWEEAVRSSPSGTAAALLARARRSFDERVPAAAARTLETSIAKLASGEAAAAREVARDLEPLRDPERSGSLAETAAYFHARALVLAGESERALVALEEALRERDEGAWEAESLVLGARLLAELGRAERARAFAEEAIERFPEDRNARLGAARVLESVGDEGPRPTGR
ncbi:MAG TPA: hypothetical protein VK116_14410, partial [Planctomycetota bacterium]|nr:hypothetical protein [Planctomycetota bacterium]